jgi:hypothetical protein
MSIPFAPRHGVREINDGGIEHVLFVSQHEAVDGPFAPGAVMTTDDKKTRHHGLRVPKTVTEKRERMYRLTLDADTLRKRLGLPADAALFHGGSEFEQAFDRLIVKYTVVG